MKIKEMFQKDIERPMYGIVKISQDFSEITEQELEEYAVTEELERNFGLFFENYCKSIRHQTEGTGVWISGPFGSGKSYFLKVLSGLLSGKSYGSRDAVSYMERKIHDKKIIKNMRKAADLHAAVVPVSFSAETGYDSSSEVIVRAFTNSFHAMRGFCGSMPWVADLEYQMEKQGFYAAFKERFKELSGSEWETAREDFYFEEENIVTALADAAQMSLKSARAWYNTAEKNYTVSFAVFADRVKEYITRETKAAGKKKFVVFLYDDAGSVFDNRGSLMLNILTLMEELGSRCKGQAWVIAAACQDIDWFAEMDESDTSKIKNRFGIRLPLSGAETEEIVKKVLLSKTDCADSKLRDLYKEKLEAIKESVPVFSGMSEKDVCFSEDDFAACYPFLPYQIELLRASIESFSIHGRAGRHLTGHLTGCTRSLLNFFQTAAVQYKDFEAGTLIPFNAFWREIDLFFDMDIRLIFTIANAWAENQAETLQPFDVQVLQVLCMIKYISDRMQSTLENIAAIMTSHVDQNREELRDRVRASLGRLSEKGLIIENGNQFIFQNDREQEINKKIDEILIDNRAVIESLGADIFNILLGAERVYHYGGHYNFPLNTVIDQQPYGAQDGELGIRILISSEIYNDEDGRNPQLLSEREKNVILSMHGVEAIVKERKRAAQIAAYMRQTSGKMYSSQAEEIRKEKLEEGKQREKRSQELIAQALRDADIYVQGKLQKPDEKEASLRLKEACRVLVESVYTKLNDITDYCFSIDDLWELLNKESEPSANQKAVCGMLDFVSSSVSDHKTITVGSLMNQFGRIPYGWKPYDIAGIVLILFQRREIRLELNGRAIDRDDRNVIAYVTEPEFFDCITVKKQIKISPELLDNARTIAANVFHETNIPEEEDGLMTCLKGLAEKELSRYDVQNPGIRQLLGEYNKKNYPGKPVLEKGGKLLENMIGQDDTSSFFNRLWRDKKKILDCFNDLQTVKNFFRNHRAVFDKALSLLTIYEKSRFYLQEDEIKQIADDITKIIHLPSTYSGIDKLAGLTEEFDTHYKKILSEECRLVRAEIESDRELVCRDLKKHVFADQFDECVKKEFMELEFRLMHTNSIIEAVAMRTESERMKRRFLQRLEEEMC